MNRYTITLHDEHNGELRIPAHILRDLLDALIDGARQATRFAVEGISVRPARRPKWLDAACTFDVIGLRGGSTVLDKEAPTLAEAAPDQFPADKPTLFDNLAAADGVDDVRTDWTPLDYFGHTLAAAATGDRERVKADRPLLDACIRLLSVVPADVSEVAFQGLRGFDTPLKVRPSAIQQIERLRDAIPAPRAVRVAGMLDTISATRQNVQILLESGERIVVWLFMHSPDHLRELFQKQVVVSGIAHYRPNGKLRQIEAESLDAAREADALFTELPPPPETEAVYTPQPQDDSSGVAAFFGTWDGDETDEEWARMLRELD